MSVSDGRLEQITREAYTDCLEWLKDKEGLNLETKTQNKGLSLEEKEAYLKAAGEALQTIIVKKKKDDKTNVNPNIDTFRQMCRNGGIKVKEQRELFREQASLYYKFSSEDQLLAEWEAEEYEKDDDKTEVGTSTENNSIKAGVSNRKNSSNTNNVSVNKNNSSSTKMSSSNNIKEDMVVVVNDEK